MILCLVGIFILTYGLVEKIEGENKDSAITSLETNHTMGVLPINLLMSDNAFVKNYTNIKSNVAINEAFSPELTLNQTIPSKQRKVHTSTLTCLKRLSIGLGMSVLAGLAEAATLISVKIIQHDINSVQIFTFWFALPGIILSFIGMLIFERHSMSFPYNNITNLLYLLGHTGCSSLALTCWVFSMERAPAYIVGIFSNVQIPINMLLQYALFKSWQPLAGGWIDATGTAIVVIGVLIVPLITVHKLKSNESSGEQEVEYSELLP